MIRRFPPGYDWISQRGERWVEEIMSCLDADDARMEREAQMRAATG